MKKIYVSTNDEAVKTARKIFSENSNVEWIIAEGAETAGGMMFSDLLLHRSQKAVHLDAFDSIEEAKKAITG